MEKSGLTQEDIKFIFNELRKASVIWSGRKEVLNRARKRVLVGRFKNGNPRYKYHYQCAKCRKWFADMKQLEVDHIVEIGGVTGFTGDWNETLDKVFPRPVEKHLQALCFVCHEKKSAGYMTARSRYTRKKP